MSVTSGVWVWGIFISVSLCQSTTMSGLGATDTTTPQTNTTTTTGTDSILKPLYRVATVPNAPWVMKTKDGYEGFIVDLLDAIAKRANFNFVLQDSSDGSYGHMDHYTRRWRGVIGDITNRIADLGAADLRITDERSRAVSFSLPFITSGAQILIRKPDPVPSKVLFLLFPFTAGAWVLLLVTVILMGGAFYLIDRFGPYGWRGISDERDKRHGKNSYRLGNSYVFVLSTFTLQGFRETPKALSGRILAVFWWAFTLMILLAYTASLTALLVYSSSRPVVPFKTFDQMSRQSDVAYGGWFGMILNPGDPLQRTLDRFMASRYTHYITMEEAVSRVSNRDRPFAAIVEGKEGEFWARRQCDLLLLRERLFEVGYGLACPLTPAGERLCADISSAVLTLRDEGVLYMLERKWWEERDRCPNTSEEDYLTNEGTSGLLSHCLGIPKISFAFIVLLVGCVLSAVALTAEICYRRRHPAKQVEAPAKEPEKEGRRSDPLGSDQQDLKLAYVEDPVSEQVEKYVEEP